MGPIFPSKLLGSASLSKKRQKKIQAQGVPANSILLVLFFETPCRCRLHTECTMHMTKLLISGGQRGRCTAQVHVDYGGGLNKHLVVNSATTARESRGLNKQFQLVVNSAEQPLQVFQPPHDDQSHHKPPCITNKNNTERQDCNMIKVNKTI